MLTRETQVVRFAAFDIREHAMHNQSILPLITAKR